MKALDMSSSIPTQLAGPAIVKMPFKRLMQRLRIPIALTLALLLLFFAKPSFATVTIGCTLAFVGLCIRAWAAGHIRKDHTLAISGPYAYTRNPLYFGSFLLGAGFACASGVWWIGLVFVTYFFSVYIPVMQAEAVDLTKLFGANFQAYVASVPLFFPCLTTSVRSDNHFDVSLYLRHREYRVIIGFVLASIFLVARTIFA